MGLARNHMWGAVALCLALFGCVRKDMGYPVAVSLQGNGRIEVITTPIPDLRVPDTIVAVPQKADREDGLGTVEETPDTEQRQPEPIEPQTASTGSDIANRRSKRPKTHFINREVRSSNIGMFPRWTGMLSRFYTEARTLDGVCGAEQNTPCKLKQWKDFLEALRPLPLREKLQEVNRYLNKYPYVDDVVNWGVDNYWETPYEFQRKSGNCKDYAIAKYMSLRAIGVPVSKMRVMVLKDLNLGGIIHAVLVVNDGETSYILDNQIKQLVTTDEVYHYMPIYSINEEYWWQHFMLE